MTKKLLLILFAFLLSNSNFFAQSLGDNKHNTELLKPSFTVLSNDDTQQNIYICTGAYAYAYHSRSDCPGLNNCKGDIKYTDEYTAVNSLERVPCCRCWSNVSGNCKDDNPSYGSGGGGEEAYAYVAVAIVAASAIILSNDIYVYPTYSFDNLKISNGKNFDLNNITEEIGWTFGFRKTFRHSALEYGASYLTTKSEEYNNYYNEKYYYENTRLGGHLNYVHHLFYGSTPNWLNFYFGPSVNYINNEFGYGGVTGTQFKLFDRLKFDIRYEYTTQTNQVMAGLIFTYQKEYFWHK